MFENALDCVQSLPDLIWLAGCGIRLYYMLCGQWIKDGLWLVDFVGPLFYFNALCLFLNI